MRHDMERPRRASIARRSPARPTPRSASCSATSPRSRTSTTTARRRSSDEILTDAARHDEGEHERRRFILQIIQPGLVGLMDGSVSTLAPVFAAAFATHNPWNAFVVGLAASIGAGISMGFAEALADDGKLSGRGAPLLRGLVCGLMTTAGGIGHTLPFLIPNFYYGDGRRDLSSWSSSSSDHRLDPVALHGDPAALGRGQGDDRRGAGVRGRRADRGELERYPSKGNRPARHCERSEAIQSRRAAALDCFVASLLAMMAVRFDRIPL